MKITELMDQKENMETGNAEVILQEENEILQGTELEAGSAPGFWQDDRGIGVIEIVLILVILIGLVLVFKDQITEIVTEAFTKISGDASTIIQ